MLATFIFIRLIIEVAAVPSASSFLKGRFQARQKGRLQKPLLILLVVYSGTSLSGWPGHKLRLIIHSRIVIMFPYACSPLELGHTLA